MKFLKPYLFTAIAACSFLTACQTISYLGDTYPASQDLQVFYDVHDIKKDYKVIGHITAAVYSTEDKAKQNMMAKARKVGADAIVFTGLTYTGGKDSSPVEKANVIKYTDEEKQAIGN